MLKLLTYSRLGFGGVSKLRVQKKADQKTQLF